MSKFRNFIHAQLQEMARGVRIPGNAAIFPMPPAVDNVINLVPPGMRLHVLRWILNDGLSEALWHRKNMAKEVSARTGLDIPQDALFSQVAHQQTPKLGKIADEIEQAWFQSGLEPEEIPIYERSADPDKASYLNLSDINATLSKLGLEPLHFGGKDGLIEYIERGDWNKTPYRKLGAEYNKQGHDLSLHDKVPCPNTDEQTGEHVPNCQVCGGTGEVEDTGEYKDEAGRRFFQFGLAPGEGSFRPPMADKSYYAAIHRAQKRSSAIIKQLVSAVESGQDIGPELEQLFGNSQQAQWLQNILQQHKPEAPCPNCNPEGKGTARPDCPTCGGTGIVSDPAYNVTSKEVPLHQSVALGLREKQTGDEEDDVVSVDNQADYQLLKELVSAAMDSGFSMPVNQVIGLDVPRDVQLTVGGTPVDVRNYSPDSIKKSIMNMMFDDENMTIRRNLRKRWIPGPPSGLKYEAHTLILAGVKLKMNEIAQKMGKATADKEVKKIESQLYKRVMTYVELLKGGARMPLVAKGQLQPSNIDELMAQGWKPINLKPEENNEIKSGSPLSKVFAASRRSVVIMQHPTEGGYKKLVKDKQGWHEVKAAGSEPVSIEELKSQGYQLQSMNPPRNTIAKVFGGKEKEFVIRKGQDNKWYRSQLGKPSPLSDPLLGGDIRVRPNIGTQAHLSSSKDTDQAIEYWKTHPQDFGSSEHEGDPWQDGFPLSIRMATKYKIDARGPALEKIMSLYGSEQFKFGDLKSRHEKFGIQAHLAKIPELQQNPELIEAIIKEFQEIIGEKGDVGWHENNDYMFDVQSKTFRRDVYEAFLENGFTLRYRIASGVARWNKEGYRPDRARGGNIQGKEDEFDPMANLTRDERGKASDDDGGGWGSIQDDEDEFVRKRGGRSWDQGEDEGEGEGEGEGGSWGDELAGDAADIYLKQLHQSQTKKKAPLGKALGRRLRSPKIQWAAPNIFAAEKPEEPEEAPKIIQMPQPDTTQAGQLAQLAKQRSQAALATAAKELPQSQPQGGGALARLVQQRLQQRQGMKAESRFLDYQQWREMAGTGVVWGYSRKKAKLPAGSGFNVWGEPGGMGTNISGEVDTVKEDPDGTKGVTHGRKRQTK